MSRFFQGRSFSIRCKSNRAGPFVQFDICWARRRLKTVIILAGVRCEGLRKFAEALASTTAGAVMYTPGIPGQRSGDSAAMAGIDGRLLIEVVVHGTRRELRSDLRIPIDAGTGGVYPRESTEDIWAVIGK